MNIPIYVLTLDNRRDRQDSVAKSLSEIGAKFQFIFSSKNENVKFQAMAKITQIEVAIWGSHVKALEEMLKTESQWGLILEDDFVLNKKNNSVLRNNEEIHFILNLIRDHYSILQIGFLENTYRSKSRLILGVVFKSVLRLNRFDFIGYLNNLRYLGFKKSIEINRVLKSRGFKNTKILFGLRLGSHAYFINREAALAMVDIFERRHTVSDFMTIDQYLFNLTKNLKDTSFPKSCRFSESLVAQSGSPSDNINRTSVEVLDGK